MIFRLSCLSAKSEEVDKIMGLNIGADDYVTKPFTPMELMARVNSQLQKIPEVCREAERPRRKSEYPCDRRSGAE